MITYIKQNTSHFLIVVALDSKGDYKSGLTITYEVRKSDDNSLITNGTLTNTGNIYTDTISITDIGEYYILYFTPSKYENGLETLIVQTSDINDIQASLDVLGVKLCKVLGLVQSNFRLTNQVYDANDCLTSAKMAIYNSAFDTQNQINPIAEYTAGMNRKQKRKFFAELKSSQKNKKQKLTRSDNFSIDSTPVEGSDESIEEKQED